MEWTAVSPRLIPVRLIGKKRAVKLKLDGTEVWAIGHPTESGKYQNPGQYSPTGIAVALLDTALPTRSSGHLTAEQLDWLDAGAPHQLRQVLRPQTAARQHLDAAMLEVVALKQRMLAAQPEPALALLGKIVNGADTDNTLWQQPEGPGLEAIAEGFRHLGYPDDHAINAAIRQNDGKFAVAGDASAVPC